MTSAAPSSVAGGQADALFRRRVEQARAEVARREARTPLEHLRELAAQAPPVRGMEALARPRHGALAVIAEVKRATATFADLSGLGDAGVMARFMAAGGAACVSVVTEPLRSQGSLNDLDAVRAAVDVPVLVNDLVVTPYQVHEARAHGADLLVLDSRLERLVLESLIERAASLGMTAVVEVRERAQALAAVAAGARVLAVDVRDEHTGALEPVRFAQVAEVVPDSVTRIAGGGVAGPRDVMGYARMGAHAVIVGEAVMRSTDPQQLVAQLVAAGSHPALVAALRGEER